MIARMVVQTASGPRSLRRLLGSGQLDERQLYHAALALARLQDRGIGRRLTLRDMCEVLGYMVPRRRRGA